MTLAPGEGVVEVAAGAAVVRCAATAPLRVLTPKNHGSAAWLFLSSHGGGLVDGDSLRLRLTVGARAEAYLSTQASTKVYRGASAQSLEADVGEYGLLCSLPDPVVCFAEARFRQSQSVRLGRGASLVWLDAMSGGRVEHGERWAFERYESRTRIEREGRLLLEDATCLDAAHGDLARRMRRFSALATLAAVGPRTAALRALWQQGGPLARGADAVIAPSPLEGDATMVRLAATSTRALTGALARLLAPVADLLGDDPLSRKW
jgi:urease accessory protein